MCRLKGLPGENEGSVAAARHPFGLPVWVDFWTFSLACMISRCFSPMCCPKGFECFLAGLFQLPSATDMRKYAQIIVGSLKKQGVRKYHEKATWHHLGAPTVTIFTLFGVMLASISGKKPETGCSRKTCFGENVTMLVRGL